jgi:hypothetical protein
MNRDMSGFSHKPTPAAPVSLQMALLKTASYLETSRMGSRRAQRVRGRPPSLIWCRPASTGRRPVRCQYATRMAIPQQSPSRMKRCCSTPVKKARSQPPVLSGCRLPSTILAGQLRRRPPVARCRLSRTGPKRSWCMSKATAAFTALTRRRARTSPQPLCKAQLRATEARCPFTTTGPRLRRQDARLWYATRTAKARSTKVSGYRSGYRSFVANSGADERI